jgi:hypothetical protein
VERREERRERSGEQTRRGIDLNERGKNIDHLNAAERQLRTVSGQMVCAAYKGSSLGRDSDGVGSQVVEVGRE